MEESIANAWLQDSRALGIDMVYFPTSGQESELSSIDEFNIPSSPSTLLGATAEHYSSYFGSFMQTDMACEGLKTSDPSSVSSCVTAVTSDSCREPSMSEALEQLLSCKDTENQSTWEIHSQVEILEEPLHQLPGWITPEHESFIMDGWQQSNNNNNSNSRPCIMSQQAESSSDLKSSLETELQQPWMLGMPGSETCIISPTVELLSPSLQSGILVVSSEAQPTSPLQSSDSSNQGSDANRKAAARKNRILLRQKSASQQQRGGSGAPLSHGGMDHHVNGAFSPRVLKKRYSSKIQHEFFMCNHVQVIYRSTLELFLHFRTYA